MHALIEESTAFLNEKPAARPALAPVIRFEKASLLPFFASLLASVAILTAGICLIPYDDLVQSLEYGVEPSDQSVTMDLVAAMPAEEIPDLPEPEPEPMEPIAEVAPPDKPPVVDAGDFILPEEKVIPPSPTPEPRKEIAKKPVPKKARSEMRPVQKVAKAVGDGSSPNKPGMDKTTARASRGAALVYMRNPKPPYAKAAQQAGQEGVVKLQITVDEDGVVLACHLSRSSGWPMLDESALNTVASRWKFKPRPGGGTIARVIPIRFDLKNR